MVHILCFVILAVLHDAYTQTCVPNPVTNLQLDVNNGTLYWTPSTNCDGTSYIVIIVDGADEQYYYETPNANFDIMHLPACVNHRFTITAVANYILSSEQHLTARTPADPDSQSPTISSFAATPQGDGVLLEWDVDPEYSHCVQYYRVVVWDGENSPEDRYPLQRRVVISSLVPCTNYSFTVTCIFNIGMEGRIELINHYSPARISESPTLEYVRPGISYADMAWLLPSYYFNRCPISSVIVDGSPYVNLTIPISDSRDRPPVPIHVDSLQPDSMYLFRVSLINSAGASAPFPVAIQTLPLQATN